MAKATTCQLAKTKPATPELHILMIGKPGVGKSSLANTLLGAIVCKEAAGPRASTQELGKFHHKVGSVDVYVYDTRGLFDGEKETDEIIEEIRHSTCGPPSGFDIVIVCMKFHDRFDRSNREVFKVLNKIQDVEVWSKVSVALTFSDEMPGDMREASPEEQDDKFKDTKRVWEEEVKKYLVSEKIREESGKDLSLHPVTYTGSGSEPEHYQKQLKSWLIKFVVGITKESMSSSSYEIAIYTAMALPVWCVKVGLAMVKMVGGVIKANPDIIGGMIHDMAGKGEKGYAELIEKIESLEGDIDALSAKLNAYLGKITEVIKYEGFNITDALIQKVLAVVGAAGAGTAAKIAGVSIVGVVGVGAVAIALVAGIAYLGYKNRNNNI